MDIDLSVLASRFLNKGDGIVEDALDLLSHMIFQMVVFIRQLSVKVVSTVICSTVNDMGDAIFLEDLLILSDKITAEIEEVIDDF